VGTILEEFQEVNTDLEGKKPDRNSFEGTRVGSIGFGGKKMQVAHR
jgi:hypothetical protein